MARFAITATIPTQFGFVNVTTSESTAASIDAARNAYKAECEDAQAHYPKMKLLKKIDLKGCGTGRQLRFGHPAWQMASIRWLWLSARKE